MRTIIGVIGDSDPAPETAALAEEAGAEIARAGAVLVCGGLGGVMQAAARGAKEAGGLTVGVLPSYDAQSPTRSSIFPSSPEWATPETSSSRRRPKRSSPWRARTAPSPRSLSGSSSASGSSPWDARTARRESSRRPAPVRPCEWPWAPHEGRRG